MKKHEEKTYLSECGTQENDRWTSLWSLHRTESEFSHRNFYALAYKNHKII